MIMEEVTRWNGLLESVVVKRKSNDVKLPVHEKLISAQEEELNFKMSETHFSYDVKRFLSYPDGSSHIASLMDLVESGRTRMLSPALAGITDGNCIPAMVSPAVSCLTCNDARVEPSQRNSQFSFSTRVHPENPQNHSLAMGKAKRAKHETTCDKKCMRIERTSTYLLKSSSIFTKSNSHTELVHHALQNGRESASVSVTTGVFSHHKQDAVCGHGTPDEDPTLAAADGRVVPGVPRSCTITAGEKKTCARAIIICEGSCSSRLKKVELKTPLDLRVKTSALKKPKSSPYCKKEANKTYREAHRDSHIVAERMRRKQMNEYFAVLKDIIPSSYIPRFDQATILAAAVNLVKDLEDLVKDLLDQKNERTIPVSACCSSLITVSRTLQSPESARYSSKTDVPWIDVDSGLYGQLHANVKSASGEVEVQITRTDITVTVYTSRKGTRQTIILLEAFQDLQLPVSDLSISTDESEVLYKFRTEISLRLNAKVIASRIHDSLLPLPFQYGARGLA